VEPELHAPLWRSARAWLGCVWIVDFQFTRKISTLSTSPLRVPHKRPARGVFRGRLGLSGSSSAVDIVLATTRANQVEDYQEAGGTCSGHSERVP
jgi:hypothetical protein